MSSSSSWLGTSTAFRSIAILFIICNSKHHALAFTGRNNCHLTCNNVGNGLGTKLFQPTNMHHHHGCCTLKSILFIQPRRDVSLDATQKDDTNTDDKSETPIENEPKIRPLVESNDEDVEVVFDKAEMLGMQYSTVMKEKKMRADAAKYDQINNPITQSDESNTKNDAVDDKSIPPDVVATSTQDDDISIESTTTTTNASDDKTESAGDVAVEEKSEEATETAASKEKPAEQERSDSSTDDAATTTPPPPIILLRSNEQNSGIAMKRD